MRDIEFRAKEINTNKWIYGTGIVQVEENTYNTDKWEIVQKVNYDELDYYIPLYETEQIDINTLGQYTGLKDKNKKKIFEGDIVKTNRDVIAKVLWDNYYLGYFLHVNEENSIEDFENGEQPLYDYFETIEIIGNIYDNPELLKEE